MTDEEGPTGEEDPEEGHELPEGKGTIDTAVEIADGASGGKRTLDLHAAEARTRLLLSRRSRRARGGERELYTKCNSYRPSKLFGTLL